MFAVWSLVVAVCSVGDELPFVLVRLRSLGVSGLAFDVSSGGGWRDVGEARGFGWPGGVGSWSLVFHMALSGGHRFSSGPPATILGALGAH